jgi:hypothetical protein
MAIVIFRVRSSKGNYTVSGVHIGNTHYKHTKTVVKRAQQNLLPLRRLRGFGMGPRILEGFCSCAIGSFGCIAAWCGNCLASDRRALQRVVRTAQYITGARIPVIQDL